jgi:hypothetical protein
VLHAMNLDLTARVMWCSPAILMYETASLTERLLKLEPYVTEITKILPSHASQVRNHHNTVAIQHISRSCARCVASLADLPRAQVNLEFMLKLNTELIQFEDDLAKLHASINAILFSDRDLELMNLTQRHEIGLCAQACHARVWVCVSRSCSAHRGEEQAPEPHGLLR